MMTRILPLLASLALPGCVVLAPIVIPGDSCGARGLQAFVGQDEGTVLATTFTVPIRVVGPDDVVTQDFSPERVNFRTDAAGTIVAVDCG